MARVGISLGSNLGDRSAHLRSALRGLEPLRSSTHLLLSKVFETDPVDCPSGSGAFLNAVIEIETEIPPLELLEATQRLERVLGRPLLREVNAPRTIDLDLLYYEGVMLDSPDLMLPHPRMLQRAFVLMPLATIRPDLIPPRAMESVDASGVRETSISLADGDLS